MTLLHFWWYLCRSELVNQHTVPRVPSLFHRGLTESPAGLVIDERVPSVIVRKYIPQGYIEMSKTVVMHEGYMLDATSKGAEA